MYCVLLFHIGHNFFTHCFFLFLHSDCFFAFVVCGLIQTFLHIERPTEPHILLSPQDIYSNLIKDKKQDERGCPLDRTIDWVSNHGCVLEESCPYAEMFDHLVRKDRKVHLSFTTFIYYLQNFNLFSTLIYFIFLNISILMYFRCI
jgi:hypothetical protein